MKSCFYLSLLLLVLLLVLLHASSCATRRTPVVPLRSVRTDTLQLHTLHYDSVFIRQERYQDRTHDTVYLHDRSVEYRYRLLRDTIREIRHDSIPYEVRIVEPSSPRLFPSLPQSLGWIALILIAGLGCTLLRRFVCGVSKFFRVIVSLTRQDTERTSASF